jgi:hypothetical protein
MKILFDLLLNIINIRSHPFFLQPPVGRYNYRLRRSAQFIDRECVLGEVAVNGKSKVKSLRDSFAFASALKGDCLPPLCKLAYKRDKAITWFEENQIARTRSGSTARRWNQSLLRW